MIETALASRQVNLTESCVGLTVIKDTFLGCVTIPWSLVLVFVFVEDYLTLKHEFWAVFDTAAPN